MTAEVLDVSGSGPRVVPSLALNEAWRLLRHPLTLLGLALWTLRVGQDGWAGPRPAFAALTSEMTIFWGVPVFFAANLVAGAARRAEETLSVVPCDRERRTTALCLAALGPLALTCTAQALLAGLYVVTGNELERFPSPAELGTGPLNVLGACLLGVAVARWLPWPGASVLVMLALTAFNKIMVDHGGQYMLGFYLDFTIWGPAPYLAPAGFLPGHTGPHALYLLSLALGAGALAMLRDTSRRGLWLGAGAVAVLCVVLTGIGQLP
ncbi:hypothetical protein ABZ260_01365 [Streptosporangium sp. NPDC006013]|uniref:hypothetical protein n=1 Tax=Streptosporangium sp. NPDC006013 TaxID=3155596 RepID=UPI0033B239AC